MKSSIGKINAVFGLLALLLVAMSVFSIVAATGNARAVAWVNHTHEVIEAVLTARTTLGDALRARRGYLSSGNRDALLQYRRDAALERLDLATLRHLTSNDPSVLPRADQISSQANALLAGMDSDTGSRPASARGSPRVDQPTAQVLQIYRSEAALGASERLLLLQRASDTARVSRESITAVEIAGALALLLTLFTFGKINRDHAERFHTEQERAMVREELERRVQERTSDLAVANEYLLYEVAERTRAEERLGQLAAIVESSAMPSLARA